MEAICDDGLVIDCAGYKAIDSGVVLTADEDRDRVVGFVPNERLEYLLPDDLVERERDRLGLSPPVVTSPEDLESRLDEFADELDDLREQLDGHVEDLVEDDLDGDDLDQRDALHERRRTVGDLLQQVRQRSQQIRQLSPAGNGREHDSDSAPETGTALEGTQEPVGDDVAALRTEMDDRFDRIERRLEELAGAVEDDVAGDDGDGDGDDGEGTETSDLERIDGLGSTYRGRLADAGIETTDDLAEWDPNEVAEAADASQSRAASWVERAEELVGERKRERERDEENEATG